MDLPLTTERFAPAAATVMQLATAGTLVHGGAHDLAGQFGRLLARPTPKGWALSSATGETIVAAQAAMLAVHRALTAPRPPSRTMRFGGLPY